MYRHSGIGRYLRTLVPLLLPKIHAERIRVLGQREMFEDALWVRDRRVEIVETTAPLYSFHEQCLDMFSKSVHNLLWVPHFNVPLFNFGPMIVTIHDVAALAMPEILNSSIKRSYAKLLIKRAVSQATAILCVSEFTSNELKERLTVPDSKITVTMPGLDAEWPSFAFPYLEQDTLPYLLYVGNVKPNKNLTLLLEAFSKVLDQLPHRLVIAGKVRGFGTDDEAVLRRAATMGARVRFAGEVSDSELQRLYAGAAALVLPSLYEGFGLPLLEAMKLGCPVFSSTAGSLREVGGDAVMYFNPQSVESLAMCLLHVKNSSAMDDLRVLGRARVKAFSLDRCAEQTAAVMNHVLEAV